MSSAKRDRPEIDPDSRAIVRAPVDLRLVLPDGSAVRASEIQSLADYHAACERRGLAV